MQNHQHVRHHPSTKTSTRAEALIGAFMAAVLGVVLVWGVGFSHIEALHNAAHDTRHANAFPATKASTASYEYVSANSLSSRDWLA